jgi:hypothetical protein
MLGGELSPVPKKTADKTAGFICPNLKPRRASLSIA